MSKKLTFLDKTFWITETEANPKHVAVLQLLKIPADAANDYVDKLLAEMRTFDKATAPFNCRVRTVMGYPIKFVPVEQLDMLYHVKVHNIDDLNDKPALNIFVASLHETWLDRDKPLFEFRVIENYTEETSMIFYRSHHMFCDGVGVSSLLSTINDDQFSAKHKKKVFKPGFFQKLRLSQR